MKKNKIIMMFLVVLALSACTETNPEQGATGAVPVFSEMDDITGYVGENVNILEGVLVTDQEDGDLTDNVGVSNLNDLAGNVPVLTNSGEYIIEYLVTDSDGNEVRALRVFTVLTNTSMCNTSIEGMTMTFCDDFLDSENSDASGLDTTKWTYQNGDGSQFGIPGWGNNEKQYYQEDNSYVNEGFLYIEAKLENTSGYNYTSGKLVTEDNFSQTYGRFEARIKLPLGDGLWPAFWMLPEDSVYGGWARSGEIDIMEAKGRLENHASGAIHYGGSWPNNTYQSGSHDFLDGEGIDTFHVYAVEWTETSIKWYFDDTLVWEATSWYSEGNEFPAPFNQDFYLVLNLAIGGNFDGNILPPDSLFNDSVLMVVDYVRVFEYND